MSRRAASSSRAEPASHSVRSASIPRATYRLQLHADFTFADATALVPYLAALGISHVYCSPYFRARPGSTHGYDVVDHADFNPQIGTREDFEKFVAALRAHDMGHILDFVPNHVGIGPDNAWWMDVLENGRESRYADFFDIDWEPADPTLAGKVLVPVLGDRYGVVLESGELRLAHDPDTDSFSVRYHEHRFPIHKRDHPRARELLDAGIPDIDGLHELLERQAYRLAYWRVASDEINYRRFFDVNDLAALRMENTEVFEATHRLVFELVREGKLDGLRIDHPDGLYDPQLYFQRLQDRIREAAGHRPLYLVVEKILAGFERLPFSWPVHGTTGYNFANIVNGLLVDSAAKNRMDRVYRSFVGEPFVWKDLVYESQRQILETSLASELNMLANRLGRIARADRRTRDFTFSSLHQALADVIACFPVYRTYVNDGVSPEDRRFIEWAVASAKSRGLGLDVVLYDFVRVALLMELPGMDTDASSDLSQRMRAFAMKFQQVTAPVMAKGVEDTALYRFHRLTSLNEVGGDPQTFGISLRAFHADAKYRAHHWPHEMLATSTHDTKRSEDVRARIDVLSEMPGLWRRLIGRWSRMNRLRKREIEGRPAPGPNQEYLLYQTLLGTWPLQEMDEAALETYRQRIEAYMIKASREAKVRTSWSDTSQDYEAALTQFVRALLEPREGNLFLAEIQSVQRRIARFGLLNSLSQTLAKLTAPGVPDLYQGNELWDFSLVDPDNRRPVDYETRRRLLTELERDSANTPRLARSLLDTLDDGRAKLYVIWKTLRFRKLHAALFRDGEYLPLRTAGVHANHLCAYARRSQEDFVLVIIPRLYARLLGEKDAMPLGGEVWDDTSIELPPSLPQGGFRNVFDETHAAPQQTEGRKVLLAAQALSHFPVALLESTSLESTS